MRGDGSLYPPPNVIQPHEQKEEVNKEATRTRRLRAIDELELLRREVLEAHEVALRTAWFTLKRASPDR